MTKQYCVHYHKFLSLFPVPLQYQKHIEDNIFQSDKPHDKNNTLYFFIQVEWWL